MTKQKEQVNTRDEKIKSYRSCEGGGYWVEEPNPNYEPPKPEPAKVAAQLIEAESTAQFMQRSSLKADLVPMNERIAAINVAYDYLNPEEMLVINDDPVFKVGSFFVPDNAVERPTSGVVAMVGSAVEEKTGGKIKVGKRVVYPVYAGTAISFRGWNVRIMKHTEIVCGISDSAPEDAFQREVVK